jgi:hypothetical protein
MRHREGAEAAGLRRCVVRARVRVHGHEGEGGCGGEYGHEHACVVGGERAVGSVVAAAAAAAAAGECAALAGQDARYSTVWLSRGASERCEQRLGRSRAATGRRRCDCRWILRGHGTHACPRQTCARHCRTSRGCGWWPGGRSGGRGAARRGRARSGRALRGGRRRARMRRYGRACGRGEAQCRPGWCAGRAQARAQRWQQQRRRGPRWGSPGPRERAAGCGGVVVGGVGVSVSGVCARGEDAGRVVGVADAAAAERVWWVHGRSGRRRGVRRRRQRQRRRRRAAGRAREARTAAAAGWQCERGRGAAGP